MKNWKAINKASLPAMHLPTIGTGAILRIVDSAIALTEAKRWNRRHTYGGSRVIELVAVMIVPAQQGRADGRHKGRHQCVSSPFLLSLACLARAAA
jgi:hypothetical protein